ncbi:retrotransposon ORF1 [Tanacetum coccineum]
MSGSIPSIFLRNPIILEGYPYNLKIPCNIGYVHIEKAYIDLKSPLNIMTRMMYNWIMRRKLDPRGNANGGINNFTGRIKGMHVFVGNFTYVVDFIIVEDIGSIIDPRLSQVILGRPFVEISNMTHDPPEGVVRFVKGADEVAYKMPHKIEQYDSLTRSYPVGIIKDVEVHIGKLKLLNEFYVLNMKKDPETPLLVGRGFLAIAKAVIDCRMTKIAIGEGITKSIFSVKGIELGEEEAPYWTTLGKRESYKPRPSTDGIGTKPSYYARKDFIDCHLPGEWEISRDAELNPFKDTLVFRRMVEKCLMMIRD